MKYLLFILSAACAFAYSNPNDEILESIDPINYYAAEFQDGIGAIWDGKTLVGKRYSNLVTPEYFTENWPDFNMRGVLSCDGDYYDALKDINSKKYECIKYYVYDAPGKNGDINTHLKRLEKWLQSHPVSNIKIIKQHEFSTKAQLQRFFEEAVSKGKEGIVLSGKGDQVKKDHRKFIVLRKFFKDLCTISKVNLDDNGKLLSYDCEWNTALGLRSARKSSEQEKLILLGQVATIKITSGFSQEHINHPLAVGTQIGFRYSALDESARPSRAYFLRDF